MTKVIKVENSIDHGTFSFILFNSIGIYYIFLCGLPVTIFYNVRFDSRLCVTFSSLFASVLPKILLRMYEKIVDYTDSVMRETRVIFDPSPQ